MKDENVLKFCRVKALMFKEEHEEESVCNFMFTRRSKDDLLARVTQIRFSELPVEIVCNVL
jgi:hypothetical protein